MKLNGKEREEKRERPRRHGVSARKVGNLSTDFGLPPTLVVSYLSIATTKSTT